MVGEGADLGGAAVIADADDGHLHVCKPCTGQPGWVGHVASWIKLCGWKGARSGWVGLSPRTDRYPNTPAYVCVYSFVHLAPLDHQDELLHAAAVRARHAVHLVHDDHPAPGVGGGVGGGLALLPAAKGGGGGGCWWYSVCKGGVGGYGLMVRVWCRRVLCTYLCKHVEPPLRR